MKQLLIFLVSLLPTVLNAQMVQPVKWTTEFDVNGEEATLTLKATVDEGWHMYSTETPQGDFLPGVPELTYSTISGLEPVGGLTYDVKPISEYDNMFEEELSFWEGAVTLTQKYSVTGPIALVGSLSYQACSDMNCTMGNEEFTFGDASAIAAATSSQQAGPGQSNDYTSRKYWQPVTAINQAEDISDTGIFTIFILGFLGGLVALFTPCVWPMIPLTVSFFLKKSKSRSKSIREASIYGASIVVIYLVLGLLITIIFGAGKLNELSTNSTFNLIFFAMLVVFAISFFGAFDIKLPSRWSNSMDAKAETTTGMLSIFFMAFTLVLVSFSCTGPIIGTLLVEAATKGSYLGPAVGMGGFALALAIPFALFAMFPSVLQGMPRSGGWLNSVKVVLGFLELALSLKFLSVADLAYGWGILDREVFVSLWVVIFTLLGLYLLGKIRFPHDSPSQSTSVGGFFMALASLSFAVYLLPGLWGAPLKAVSAFVPPLNTQDFNLYQNDEIRTFDDFEEGMRYAEENGLPVMMDFSGYGCVNCREMEGAVFDTKEISDLLNNKFVVIELMVDDKHALDVPIKVTENGKEITLRTVGDKWSFLQRHKFAANSQPYYMILDNNGDAISPSYAHDTDVEKFRKFLNDALKRYNNPISLQ